jgi:scyllo-inositol 2-dehydrogenase (NADP+)
MLAPANELKFVLHGSEASFVKSGLDGQEAALGAGGPVLPADGENWAVEPATFAGVLTSGRSGAAETVPSVYTSYVRFYSAFAAALRAPEPLRTQEVLPEMALLLLRVIETARRSSASGRVEPLVPVPDI